MQNDAYGNPNTNLGENASKKFFIVEMVCDYIKQ